jgi:hypothetical protein
MFPTNAKIPFFFHKLTAIDTYPVQSCTGIDALNPKGSHIPLLVTPVPVRILQGFLDPLPCYPYAILRPSSKSLSQLENLALIHFPVTGSPE